MIKNKNELKDSKKYKKITEKKTFIPVYVEWAVRFELSPSELLIYSAIAHFTKITKKDGYGAFTAPVSTLQSLFNLSYKTVFNALESLVFRGLITKYKVITDDGKGITAYRQAKIIQLSIDETQDEALK